MGWRSDLAACPSLWPGAGGNPARSLGVEAQGRPAACFPCPCLFACSPWPVLEATAWVAAWGWAYQKANPQPLPPGLARWGVKTGEENSMLLLQVIAGPHFTRVRRGDHDPLRMHPCRVWGKAATWLCRQGPSRAAQRAAGATPGAQHMTEIIRSQKPDVKSNQVAIFAMVERWLISGPFVLAQCTAVQCSAGRRGAVTSVRFLSGSFPRFCGLPSDDYNDGQG